MSSHDSSKYFYNALDKFKLSLSEYDSKILEYVKHVKRENGVMMVPLYLEDGSGILTDTIDVFCRAMFSEIESGEYLPWSLECYIKDKKYTTSVCVPRVRFRKDDAVFQLPPLQRMWRSADCDFGGTVEALGNILFDNYFKARLTNEFGELGSLSWIADSGGLVRFELQFGKPIPVRNYGGW